MTKEGDRGKNSKEVTAERIEALEASDELKALLFDMAKQVKRNKEALEKIKAKWLIGL